MKYIIKYQKDMKIFQYSKLVVALVTQYQYIM